MQEGDNRNNGNNTRSILMALVACYIIYLGVNILRGMFQGEGGMPFGLGVFFGIVFVAAGGAYLIYLLRQFLMSGSAKKEEAAENESPEKPAEELPEKQAEELTEKPEERQAEELPEKPAEELPEKPEEKPAEELPEKQTEELPEKPAGKPEEKLPEKPAEGTSDQA